MYISLHFNFQKRLVAGKHINISAYKICLWYFISRELIEFAESVLIISISITISFYGDAVSFELDILTSWRIFGEQRISLASNFMRVSIRSTHIVSISQCAQDAWRLYRNGIFRENLIWIFCGFSFIDSDCFRLDTR